MSDPLRNPRQPWQLNYAHQSLAGRWGRFLQLTLRLKTSGDRYLDDLRRLYQKSVNGRAE